MNNRVDMDINELFQSLKGITSRYHHEKEDGGFSFILPKAEKNLEDVIASFAFAEDAFSFYALYHEDLSVEFSEVASLLNSSSIKVEVSFREFKEKGVCIYWNWNQYLKNKTHYLKPDKQFIILTDEVIYPANNQVGRLKNYLDVCSLMALLRDNADYERKLGDVAVSEITFLHKTKFSIPIDYSEKELESPLDGISQLLAHFKDEAHQEQKISILKEVLHGLVGSLPDKERFTVLLRQFSDFSTRFTENYQLFVSEFSFDKVRKEYEESKREYLVKLNEIFSSVYTKMLGIPISIGIGSMRFSHLSNEAEFAGNFLLLVAVTIYVIMMKLLLESQNHSLQAIKTEYDSQMNRLKYYYSSQWKLIESINEELDRRFTNHTKHLALFRHIANLLLYVVVFCYFLLPWSEITSHWLGFACYLTEEFIVPMLNNDRLAYCQLY